MNSETINRASEALNKRLTYYETAFEKAQKDYKMASKSNDEASVAYYEKELQSYNLVINELKSLANELR